MLVSQLIILVWPIQFAQPIGLLNLCVCVCVLLRMMVSTERCVRSLHSRIVVRATTDKADQRRQLIQFYSLTKHNLQTTHNPAGATARTAIRLTRATQSPLRTPAGNRLQTSSARVQHFLLNISYSRVNTHSHTVFRLPRQPSTACLLDRVLHHCFSHTGFPQTALVATQLPTHCFVPTVNQLKLTASWLYNYPYSASMPVPLSCIT